jgi:hypothetical protein
MQKLYFTLFLWILANVANAQNTSPVILIQHVTIDVASKTVTIGYDLTDAQNDVCEVWVKASSQWSEFYEPIDSASLSGDIGTGIVPGASKSVTWHYDTLLPNIYDVRIGVYASDNQPFNIQDLADQVDSVKLREYLTYIEGVRHYLSGPAKLAEVRDSLEAIFNRSGLGTERQSFPYNTVQGFNLVGRKAGMADESLTYIVCGHYDGVPGSPGADDNGSAVAGFLEILRILAPYHFKHSIRFIGFDFEEMGLIGSKRYVQNAIPPYDSIAGVLNFEMIGYYSNEPNTQSLPAGFNLLFPQQYQQVIGDSSRGNFLLVCGNAYSADLTTQYVNAAAQYVPDLRVISLNVPGNGQSVPDLRRSDHAPFWDAGKKALMLTDGADTRNYHYHTPGDSIGTLNFTFMSRIVKATLATLATLAVPISAGYDTFNLKVLAVPDAKPLSAGNLILFPNPAQSEITLAINAHQASESLVQIFDVAGNLTAQKRYPVSKGSTMLKMEISHLRSGIYTIRYTSEHEVLSGKLVKY